MQCKHQQQPYVVSSCKQCTPSGPAPLSLGSLMDQMFAGNATTLVQFTPVPALLGGLVLGIAAVGKFAITGRILGISGALK